MRDRVNVYVLISVHTRPQYTTTPPPLFANCNIVYRATVGVARLGGDQKRRAAAPAHLVGPRSNLRALGHQKLRHVRTTRRTRPVQRRPAALKNDREGGGSNMVKSLHMQSTVLGIEKHGDN